MPKPLFSPGRLLLANTLFTFSFATTVNPTSSFAQTTAPTFSATATRPENNAVLAPWAGSYGGVPAFDKIEVAQFKPALEAAMAENLKEIQAIASNSQASTFENTIAALERAGKTLDQVRTVYGVWTGTMSSPEVQLVEREMAPKMAAFSDQITQNEPLFRRIEAVYNSPDKKKLTPEQQRLAFVYYNNFVRAGAKLDAKAKMRLSAINQELAGLFTRFSQNVLADETDSVLVLKAPADLGGLPTSLREDAANAATARKLSAAGVITNTRSSIDPFLTYSDQRKLREKAWRMFVNRGDNGGAHDNNALITQILQLRAERAKLLGYATHAHLRLDNTMAKTPEKAMALMEEVWTPAVARVKEEVADMQALAKKEGATFKIEPWDYRYYAEKVRKERYDLDQNEVKQYLQLDKMREGMFWVAGELFNFTFSPVTNVPVYHPDVKVWEVKDKTSGKPVGLWYFDPYARTGKRSGAWMNAYRKQERIDGKPVTTIVSNNSNFVKGKDSVPTLISWTDATTLFHEFGHALHGLSSNVTYPTLSGTSVVRDYVEFPSQVLENWLSTPQVLQRFAVHYQTGKPIPQALVDRIEKAATFNQGFETTEFLASALIDMKLHLAGDQKIDPDKFERETLAQLGMPSEIVMRHRTPQFSHVFSSDGYSAGYYSYLWSVVIAADAYGAFTEAGGPYDKAVGKRLTQQIFSVGNTVDPAEAYRSFRGRDPKTEALMRERGFPVKDAKASKTTDKKAPGKKKG
ncbi:peptidyl-dipeptidase Dcp . Metallo peptidase. MEROPS family M03A [Hymenobacter roseosalivarius DSM 11622]|uniref:Peptidyl-dipeptidase Dcp. Metallo peptidase. MEROPS family M03A n=1 Tax=Hymenobacter roseosalivarius DSM 11622 TaxID=645990 RepID=A0A1W1VYI6_9BACT|nr:peptidyl-dipeptidase Dcp . Metallo peptidase. MEROPS family M03A [Hymenobacter roseosalivarius DSM 11622]